MSETEDAITTSDIQEEAALAPAEDDPASSETVAVEEDALGEVSVETDVVDAGKSQVNDPAPEENAEASQAEDPATDMVVEADLSEDTEDAAAEEEPVLATPVPPVEPRQPDPEPAKKGGGFSAVLSGVVAGAIGFGAAYFVLQGGSSDGPTTAELQQQLNREASRLSDMSVRLNSLQQSVDSAPDVTGQITALADRIAALEAALADLPAAASQSGGGDVPADVQKTLNDLRAALQAQQETVQQLQADAQQVKANAQNAANATLQRAAVSRLQTALDNGTAFSDAVADLSRLGVTIPAALSDNAQSGIASLSDLQARFPDAARAALSAAREAGDADGSATSLTAFMRKQLGVRSLEPQEGDSVDAILSRVEAATREGRLQDALTEADSLPDIARAPLAIWAGDVANRLSVLDAAQALSDTLN